MPGKIRRSLVVLPKTVLDSEVGYDRSHAMQKSKESVEEAERRAFAAQSSEGQTRSKSQPQLCGSDEPQPRGTRVWPRRHELGQQRQHQPNLPASDLSAINLADRLCTITALSLNAASIWTLVARDNEDDSLSGRHILSTPCATQISRSPQFRVMSPPCGLLKCSPASCVTGCVCTRPGRRCRCSCTV